MSDRIAVMNKGKIVEIGVAETVYTQAQDDYTKALLAAVPILDPHKSARPPRGVPQAEGCPRRTGLTPASSRERSVSLSSWSGSRSA